MSYSDVRIDPPLLRTLPMFAEGCFPRLSKSKKTLLFRPSRPGPATSVGNEARAKGLPQPLKIQTYTFSLVLMINGLKSF